MFTRGTIERESGAPTQPRKLSLGRETLRLLTPEHLSMVAGGSDDAVDKTASCCTSACCTCHC